MDALQNEKNFGTLVVQVSAASGTVPITGASVVVRGADENGEIRTLGVFLTDESGITAPFSIQTPSVSESLSPNGRRPFSEITAEVLADGYYPSVNINIPIYPGITSIQPVNLIPLPESARGRQPASGVVIHNDKQAPDL